MFWAILLAHFLADFPLQPNWMVRAKQKPWVLGLHIATHLVVMALISATIFSQIWPYLLLVAFIHLGIDIVKNEVWRRRPDLLVGPYIIDQIFHYLSIALVAFLIQLNLGDLTIPIARPVLVLATGYLVVTYVWFISERIFAYANRAYRQTVVDQLWPRMAGRAIWLSIFLWIFSTVIGPLTILTTFQLPLLAMAGVMPSLPYISGKYASRALVIDISVALVVAFLTRLAL